MVDKVLCDKLSNMLGFNHNNRSSQALSYLILKRLSVASDIDDNMLHEFVKKELVNCLRALAKEDDDSAMAFVIACLGYARAFAVVGQLRDGHSFEVSSATWQVVSSFSVKVIGGVEGEESC